MSKSNDKDKELKNNSFNKFINERSLIKSPKDISKYILNDKLDSKLSVLRPKMIPKDKDQARALMIVFNNIAVQYEQTGQKKIALEF